MAKTGDVRFLCFATEAACSYQGADGPEFALHKIHDTFSQPHSLMIADLNQDGKPDSVSGECRRAFGPHGGVNPGDPAVQDWYA